VITVPNTFIATTEAISQTGATPAFVDIDERTYNMDPTKLEDYLNKRSKEKGPRKKDEETKNQKSESLDLSPLTFRLSPDASQPSGPPPSALRPMPYANRPKAVLPVHLYGQPANMDLILEIANRYGLIVIEDACQAHGALCYSAEKDRWRKTGSMGLAAGFSFYPGKNLGACGEGGAVTTNDAAIAQKVLMLRDHGQAKKYYHDFEGYNGRLDTIQTGILRVKLRHLQEWNESRRRNASLYNAMFKVQGSRSEATEGSKVEGSALEAKGSRLKVQTSSLKPQTSNLPPQTSNLTPSACSIVTPYAPAWARGVYHLYIVRVQQREKLQAFLSENGISTGLHYPVPIHLQKAYAARGFKEGDFPVTERVSKEILSLPMFPQLSKEQIGYVASKIKEFLATNS
jgi:dTDP-4-amino-4,6-dideoxygalactose transaminase